MSKLFKNPPTESAKVSYAVREIAVLKVEGPQEINACCGDPAFEAVEFKGNPTDEEKSMIRWRITDENGFTLADFPPPVVVYPDDVPEADRTHANTRLQPKGWPAWSAVARLDAGKKKLAVWAYFENPRRDGASLTVTLEQGEDDGVCSFINLIRKIERAHAGWSGERILNGLRRITWADTYFFQWMYGFRSDAIDTATEALDEWLDSNKKWKQWINIDLDELLGDVDFGPELDYLLPDNETTRKVARLATHEHENKRTASEKEIGIVKDCTGLYVAIGHTFTGMSAGPHFNEDVWPIGVNNLYAVTISGDLGQSAVKMYYFQKTGNMNHEIDRYLGGEDSCTEATFAELVGDIDGFLLGSAYESFEDQRISDVLARYYCDPPDGAYAHCSNRFTMFESLMDWSYLVDQVELFMRAFGAFKSQEPDNVKYLQLDEVVPPLIAPSHDLEPPDVALRKAERYEEERARYDASRKVIRSHAELAVAQFKVWLAEQVAKERERGGN